MTELPVTRFPPSFDNSPLAYGFALFGLTLLSAMSLAIIAGIMLEGRHRRIINQRLGNWVKPTSLREASPLALYKLKLLSLLLTIFVGATPDVLVLLAWGEASDKAMTFLFTLDRVCDGAALLPFLVFIAAMTLGDSAVTHRLGLDPKPVSIWPRWYRVKDNLKIVFYTSLIAVLVTVYKASA